MSSVTLDRPVPGLIVADGVRAIPERTDPSASRVEICHDARGDLLGYCRAENGAFVVDLPDLASFSYRHGARHVRAIPYRPLAPEIILDTYHHCVLPLILPALGIEVLHASAVIGSGGVAAFCGVSGSGKSTIAAALACRGYAIWADDAVAVDTAAPTPMSVRLPFTVRLRPNSVRFLGVPEERPFQATASLADAPPMQIAVLCVLRQTPEGTADVAVEALETAATLREALAHAYCFSVQNPVMKRRTVRNYLTLIGRLPAYEISFRPGLERLPVLLDAIQAIAGRPSVDLR